ncbi:MAG: hypothetical protein N2203_06975 [Bacteroidia bacterium]|nr:hypothetical protein [Bacteroidia bacterium]
MFTKSFYFIFTILSILVITTNCNAQKSQTTPTPVEKPTSQNPPTKKLKFALIISFISHASGIDGEKYDAVIKYIDTHPKKPKYKQYFWGREGERDICMNLKEFNKSERKTFIEEIKKIAAGSDRVHVNTNVEKEFVLERLK